MRYLKKFERFGEINPPINLGYNIFTDGQLGALIMQDNFDEIIFIINYLNKNNIKYRLFYNESDNYFIFLLGKRKDCEELPKSANKSNPYVPFRNNKFGKELQWFFQDWFEDDDNQEVFIENEDDIKDLEEKIEIYKSTSKFNI